MKRRCPVASGLALPLKLVIMIEATNGTTALNGVEEIAKLLRSYTFPKPGQIIETNYYRATVLEVADRLLNEKRVA